MVGFGCPPRRAWKQGTAVELAKGLRYALDVEVGAVKPGF